MHKEPVRRKLVETGEPLVDRLARGSLEVEEGAAILAGVLGRLAELHAYGRVHGALGPRTVLVAFGEDGELAVTLATPTEPGPAALRAPERRAGKPASVAADLWEAGALSWLLFAGRAPVDGEALDALALAAPRVPLRLGGIVGRMLETDPARRPAAEDTLAAVRTMLEPLAPERRPPASPGAGTVSPEEPRLLTRLGGLLQRRPAPAPKATPVSVPERRRAAEVASLGLLCVADFDPIVRLAAPAPAPDLLDPLVAATLDRVRLEECLPAFPSVALQVVDLVRDEDAGIGELVRLINQDPSLTAQVLRMANSAFVSRGIEVTSARDAITRLGFREVANVAAAAATRALFDPDVSRASPAVVEAQRRIWLHALTSALAASWLATECRADAGRAFLGGMLHDIGRTVALRAASQAVADGAARGAEERAVLGPVLDAVHLEVGVRMAEAWGLPAHVIRACREHHRPRLGPHEDRELHLVRVVSGMAAMRLDPAWSPEALREAQESAALLGFDRYRIRAAAAQVRGFVAQAEALAGAAG